MATTLGGVEIDARVAELMDRDRVPGVVVGILDGDRQSVAAWGIANRETGVPMRPDSVLQIGSISKVFTATLIMGLVEEGRLLLDTPIVEMLPSFRLADETATRTITLRHCLSHTTGFEGDRFDDHGRGDDSLARCVAGYDTLAQQLPSGTAFSYCNTGFNVAGRVVEAVLGIPFERAMRERVFVPLGLAGSTDRATFFTDEAILLPAAAGHLAPPEGEVTVARPYPLARNMNAAGGIIAGVAELLRFAAAHLGLIEVPAPFPSLATLETMREAQVEIDGTTGRGLGWALERRGDEPIFGHDGATNGFKASLRILPDRQFAIALLTNGEYGVFTNRDIEREILRQRFGITVTDPEPIAMPARLAARVAGRYHAMLSEVTIAGDDGLTATTVSINPFNAERGEPVSMPLVPIGEDELMVPEGVRQGTRFQLLPDTDGRIDMIRAGGRIAVRVPDGS